MNIDTVSHKERRKNTLHHINRIEGQIRRLKQYITDDASCVDIAMLTTSIVKSFDTLRARTLEGFVLSEIARDNVSDTGLTRLRILMDLHKK